MSDQVLESGVSAVVTRCEARGQLYDEQAEILIADIHSVTIKVRIVYVLALKRCLSSSLLVYGTQKKIRCVSRRSAFCHTTG